MKCSGKLFICPFCSKLFLSNKGFIEHKKNTCKGKFDINVREQNYWTQGKLMSNFVKRLSKQKCSICNVVFKGEKTLFNHILKIHK